MIALLALLFALDFSSLMSQAGKARASQKTDEAIELYKQAVKLQPASSEAWWYLGLCFYEKDRHAEGAAAFAKVTTQFPKQGAGWAMLGVEQFNLKQYDEALASLGKANNLGVPDLNGLQKIARYHYAVLLNRAGKFELSSSLLLLFVPEGAVTPLVRTAAGIAALRLRVLPDAIPADKKEQVQLAGEAAILAWQKRVADAKKPAATLLDKYPKEPNAHYLMGYLLLLEQDPKCIDYFEEELKLQPDHVQARLQIAYEYLNRGNAAKGLSYAKEAVKRAPQDFIAHNILGRILMALDQVEAAVPELETAVKLEPASAEAHFHLATAYNRTGRKDEAARHREMFAKLDKERKKE